MARTLSGPLRVSCVTSSRKALLMRRRKAANCSGPRKVHESLLNSCSVTSSMMVTVFGVGDEETAADSTTCVREAGYQRVSASNTEFFVLGANSRAEELAGKASKPCCKWYGSWCACCCNGEVAVATFHFSQSKACKSNASHFCALEGTYCCCDRPSVEVGCKHIAQLAAIFT